MTISTFIEGEDVVTVGIIGMKILCTFVKADGTLLDISAAAEKKIRIQRPDGTSIDRDLTLETNGINGEAYYLTVANDINGAEKYTAQGWVKFAGGLEGWSLPVRFRAVANLPAP